MNLSSNEEKIKILKHLQYLIYQNYRNPESTADKLDEHMLQLDDGKNLGRYHYLTLFCSKCFCLKYFESDVSSWHGEDKS